MKTSRCKRFVEKTAREGGKKKALGQLPGASDTALAYRRLQTVFVKEIWWRFTDSNRGPVDYDSIALTD